MKSTTKSIPLIGAALASLFLGLAAPA